MKHKMIALLSVCAFVLIMSATVFADINRVRVINQTDIPIYIHKGGYAPSVSISPNEWKIFYYPFYVIPPGTDKKISTSLLVATAGGQWITTPNGFTTLYQPKMIVCLNYQNTEHQKKSGDRVWVIQKSEGFDKDCAIKGYKQSWYQDNNSQS